jgi:hypothetical protein
MCWTLPAVGFFPGRLGYYSLYRYLTNYRTTSHPQRQVRQIAVRNDRLYSMQIHVP